MQTTTRLNLNDLPAMPKPARKRTTKPVVTPIALPAKAPSRKAVLAASHAASRQTWAHIGVYTSVALSALLNGYSNSTHAPKDSVGVWVCAIGLGVVVPFIVFVLAKVAGSQWRDAGTGWTQRRVLALITAGVGGVLLALSVRHCADAIYLLTGMSWNQALMLAIAIDCGLVACELEVVTG